MFLLLMMEDEVDSKGISIQNVRGFPPPLGMDGVTVWWWDEFSPREVGTKMKSKRIRRLYQVLRSCINVLMMCKLALNRLERPQLTLAFTDGLSVGFNVQGLPLLISLPPSQISVFPASTVKEKGRYISSFTAHSVCGG